MVPFVARLHHTVPWTGISFLRIPSASQMLQKMQKMKSNDRWELWIHMKNKNKNYSRMFLFLPDLTLSVKEPCNEGNLLAILVEVDVSACSHAWDRFKSIFPSSWPHWKLQVNFEVQISSIKYHSNLFIYLIFQYMAENKHLEKLLS